MQNPKHEISESEEVQLLLDQIAAATGDFSKLAWYQGFETLSYLLELARLEASQAITRSNPDA